MLRSALASVLVVTTLGCRGSTSDEAVDPPPISDPVPSPTNTREPPPPPPPPAPAALEPEPEIDIPTRDDGEAPTLPLADVMTRAVYTPPPDQAQLRRSKAAKDERDGASIVSFCVDPQGKTTRVRTGEKFPDDPLVDKLLRDTVAKWRFKPFLVDGEATTVCTERRFELEFE